jgi:hypothetical protein
MEVDDVVADGSAANLQRAVGFRLRYVVPVARPKVLLPFCRFE